MKFLLAFAAFLIAAISVAAAAHGIDPGGAAASRHAAQATDHAGHDNGDKAPAAPDCDYSAVCAFACGILAPSLFEAARVFDFTPVEYSLSAADRNGAANRPEAPPPRSIFL